MLKIAFYRWMDRLTWLWGTHGGMCEDNMVGFCRFEDTSSTAVFKIFIPKINTSVSMFFIPRKVSGSNGEW